MKTSFLLSTFRIVMLLVLILAAVCWALLSPKRWLAIGARAVQLETRLVDQYQDCGDVYSVTLQENHIFLGCDTRMDVLDVSDPENASYVGSRNLAASGAG